MFKVFLSGRITKDPEIKCLENSNKVCNFTIAINSTRNSDETIFVKCAVWNKMAENFEKYIKKGRQLFISGEGQLKKYTDKDGVERDSFYVICDSVDYGAGIKADNQNTELTIDENNVI